MLNTNLANAEHERTLLDEKYSELAVKYDELVSLSSLQTKQFDLERKTLKCQLDEIEQTCIKISSEKDELLATLARDESEKVQVHNIF